MEKPKIIITPGKPKIVIVSGYFNPLHKGHLEYFHNARELGDTLFVIVNSDYQRELKGSKEFQDQDERLLIISNLAIVDACTIAIDKDRTVRETLREIHSSFRDSVELIFANGGDQNNDTIPEREVCEELGIKLADGLGGKIQSSSWLLNK
jgi:cytidyltransferase-like protein